MTTVLGPTDAVVAHVAVCCQRCADKYPTRRPGLLARVNFAADGSQMIYWIERKGRVAAEHLAAGVAPTRLHAHPHLKQRRAAVVEHRCHSCRHLHRIRVGKLLRTAESARAQQVERIFV
jgi:hypothetical protein